MSATWKDDIGLHDWASMEKHAKKVDIYIDAKGKSYVVTLDGDDNPVWAYIDTLPHLEDLPSKDGVQAAQDYIDSTPYVEDSDDWVKGLYKAIKGAT
jgi:hypothetical protein